MNVTLKERLEEHLRSTGKSQNALAKEIGISSAALSQYLAGKYQAQGNSNIEPKIEEFFSLTEKAAAFTTAPDYVATSISTDVYNVIDYCHVSRCMGTIIGDAGIGKTKGAEKYASDYSEAIYITATKACKSQKNIYRMIARKLRLNENRNVFDLYYDIRSKLDGSNKILIIDEAQHLSVAAIDDIRFFNDKSDESDLPSVGIVLIGNHELRTKMMGRYEQTLAQLFNRIQIQRLMFTTQVLVEDIKKLFPVYADKGINTEKEIRFLHGIATSRWGVRGAVKVFLNSSNNGDISPSGLTTMAKYMGIGFPA
ncbi:Putative ATPase, transposase-like protein [Desulfofarcimen acetoxidans DSM 771]|uniref:Putative ATPase, transposase-like protein n=1 Tax=Desulfofarcimen acetoxidans (strain ATCC 49208 / DSM 771 / KCTC 5769 / VKM B-1644 / 5575) TaxID=485916 RepID=C8VZD8_DESAS|nr:AAA family ATPase [Desulfofarcimen acetoxidans]ACV64883.1 Putative ATPase, transposase-like protein [Desulfofarcimen acetoxidans DSM 771]